MDNAQNKKYVNKSTGGVDNASKDNLNKVNAVKIPLKIPMPISNIKRNAYGTSYKKPNK